MTSCVRNFMTSVLISICFETLITGSRLEYNACKKNMVYYCGDTYLNTLHCAERAVVHFTHDTIMPLHMKNYHLEFAPHLTPDEGMLLPTQFCENKKRCLSDLNYFSNAIPASEGLDRMGKLKHILTYAFYYTYFSNEYEAGNFSIDYLDHISENINVDEINMPAPVTYCKKQFLDGGKENLPTNQLELEPLVNGYHNYIVE